MTSLSTAPVNCKRNVSQQEVLPKRRATVKLHIPTRIPKILAKRGLTIFRLIVVMILLVDRADNQNHFLRWQRISRKGSMSKIML